MAVGRLLVVVTFVLFALAALATAGILVPAAWWQGLLVASSLASLAMLVVWFAPTLLLGILIDIALVWLAIAGPWSPALTRGSTSPATAEAGRATMAS